MRPRHVGVAIIVIIARRIAQSVERYRTDIVFRQLIAPRAVAVGVRLRLLRLSQRAKREIIRLLRQKIARVVIAVGIRHVGIAVILTRELMQIIVFIRTPKHPADVDVRDVAAGIIAVGVGRGCAADRLGQGLYPVRRGIAEAALTFRVAVRLRYRQAAVGQRAVRHAAETVVAVGITVRRVQNAVIHRRQTLHAVIDIRACVGVLDTVQGIAVHVLADKPHRIVRHVLVKLCRQAAVFVKPHHPARFTLGVVAVHRLGVRNMVNDRRNKALLVVKIRLFQTVRISVIRTVTRRKASATPSGSGICRFLMELQNNLNLF